MKPAIKILRAIILIFALVFVVVYIFIVFQGKAIIAGQLETLLRRKVSINYAGLILPLDLEIKNLDIPGLGKIDYALISPSIPGLLSGKIVLNGLKLINPQLAYEKTQDKDSRDDSEKKIQLRSPSVHEGSLR